MKRIKRIRCLNLGSGNSYFESSDKEDWVNLDIDRRFKADVYHNLNETPFPFKNDYFDEIHCDNLFEHLTVKDLDFFQEIYRILKPGTRMYQGGKLIFKSPNAFFITHRIRFLFGIVGNPYHPYHLKMIKPSSLFELLRRIGFRVCSKKQPVFRDLLNDNIDFVAYKRL